MKILTIRSLRELPLAAKQFVQITQGSRKYAIYGKMGVGKTTFIKAVCLELEASDVVSSPSFAIINVYQTLSGTSIYHFDLYRIRDKKELFDLGYEDYFYSDAYVFVEWPEKAEEILPEDMIRVNITESDDGTRIISL